MALVMLPCDLPWWTSVQRHLKHLLLASTSDKLVDGMLKVHDMCNIGLDPDEDGSGKDPELLRGLAQFLEQLPAEERRRFMDSTLRVMVTRALQLRRWKPAKGLVFSLQQQSDVTELDYNFVSSLIAHSFFSTFPKRTLKTHPTLQDFNFTHFFKNLHRKSQRCKLKSLLHYYEWLDKNNVEGSIKITRKVMTAKQWLTIEDWLECSLPLCRLLVRHEGRPERCEMDDAIRVCFASSRLGGDVLIDGESQESLAMFMMPELLAALLSVEALEDNEVVMVEGARMFSRIADARHKEPLETLDQPKEVTVCMMDAENYRQLPLSQWEEDNVLRELNKCLLGFQQAPAQHLPRDHSRPHERRLSPIGESISHTPPEVEATVMIKQSSCSTVNSYHSRSPTPDAYCSATLNLNDPSIEITKRKCWLSPDGNTLNNRRGRFIVLGSSGECLPVSRGAGDAGGAGAADTPQGDSLYSSCNSSDDEFHSANGSFDDGSEDEGRGASGRPSCFQYTTELSTEARRLSFATRLREALRREADRSRSSSSAGCSTDSSSYAVGISISGAELNDQDIRVKRGGSVGFVLTDKDSVISNGGALSPPHRHPSAARRDTGNSSKYSFSTEYSSELEEVYEQFSAWLEDPIVDAASGEPHARELDSRDVAVIRFAGSLLKRTLSESFAGMPLTEGCAHAAGTEPAAGGGAGAGRGAERACGRHKLALTARSLSLELAKHKHRLAAQLLSQLAHKIVSGGACRPVATGNWGCGRRQKGHPQLKLLLQWLAASVAGVPALLYYTAGNDKLVKLDTVVRVLTDRKWSVGQLTRALMRFARRALQEPGTSGPEHDLFDELIGIERASADL